MVVFPETGGQSSWPERGLRSLGVEEIITRCASSQGGVVEPDAYASVGPAIGESQLREGIAPERKCEFTWIANIDRGRNSTVSAFDAVDGSHPPASKCQNGGS